jgi:hypothetical protein
MHRVSIFRLAVGILRILRNLLRYLQEHKGLMVAIRDAWGYPETNKTTVEDISFGWSKPSPLRLLSEIKVPTLAKEKCSCSEG